MVDKRNWNYAVIQGKCFFSNEYVAILHLLGLSQSVAQGLSEGQQHPQPLCDISIAASAVAVWFALCGSWDNKSINLSPEMKLIKVCKSEALYPGE